MFFSLNQVGDDVWDWEVKDEDGELYLRSEKCFRTREHAEDDLKASTYLIIPYLKQ